jgi:hypothetical protein
VAAAVALIELLSEERALCELVFEPCWVAFWFCSPDCWVLDAWLSLPILDCTFGDAVTSPVLGFAVTPCATTIWLNDTAARPASV